MFAEEKLKDYIGHSRLERTREHTVVYFDSNEDAFSFIEWLEANDYGWAETSHTVMFWKLPPCGNKMESVKKYPQLLLGKE